MACPACYESWDLQLVRPFALPCQHSMCCTCLERLTKRQCPTCHKAFSDPVLENFALVDLLKSTAEQKNPLVWWCVECRAPSSAQCVKDGHTVKRPKASLRRLLEPLVPRCVQHLEGLKDNLQEMHDGNALAVLQAIEGGAATCVVTVIPDDSSKGVSLQWRADGKVDAKFDLIKTVVVAALSGSGCPLLSNLPEEAHPRGVKRRKTDHSSHQSAQTDLTEQTERIALLSLSHYGEETDEKADALLFFRQLKEQRISDFWGDVDRVWGVDIIKEAAPVLKELQIINPLGPHLSAALAMPQLQRLHLTRQEPFMRIAMPRTLSRPAKSSPVQWLHVGGLPWSPTQSLLKWLAGSLSVLWLEVGAERGQTWPEWCGDLGGFLRPCRLKVISRLVLLRSGCDTETCRAQVRSAAGVLQKGCTVQCEHCDGVPREAF